MGSRRLFSLCAEHPAAVIGYRRRELSNGAAFWARFLNLGADFVEIKQETRPDAGNFPDHTTIARFRQDHAPLCEKLFAQVLELCAMAGLAQVGVVALDGTKVAANASRDANRDRAQLEAQRAQLAAEINEMFAQAKAARRRRGRALSAPPGRRAARAGLASATRPPSGPGQGLGRPGRAREAQHRSNRHPERWRARAEHYRAKTGRRPPAMGCPPSYQGPPGHEAPPASRARKWPASKAYWPATGPRPKPPSKPATTPRST